MDLPLWTEWDEHTKMRVLCSYRHWFLFERNGAPHVISRRRVKHEEIDPEKGPVITYRCDEEECQLDGDDKGMTEEARSQLRLAWAEHDGWQRANRGR